MVTAATLCGYSGSPASAGQAEMIAENIDTDESLIDRCRFENDATAFEELVRRYRGELLGYLRRYTGHAETAEDVFQATLLRVHASRERFDSGRRFRPWLYAIATNQAIDAKRRDRRHRMVSLDRPTGADADAGPLAAAIGGRGPQADERMQDEEQAASVQAAIDRLPDAMRIVLTLIYHDNLKYREAADLLHVPVGTVKSRLHAALARLHAHLAN